MELSRTQCNALRSLCWGLRHFGALTTNRQVRLETVRGLVDLGLAQSAGMVVVCDDDGRMGDTERWREGWRPTEAGIAMAMDIDEIGDGPERAFLLLRLAEVTKP